MAIVPPLNRPGARLKVTADGSTVNIISLFSIDPRMIPLQESLFTISGLGIIVR